MELKLFGLVSRSAVGLGEKWNGRIAFGDVMQSERGLFAMFVAIKKWSKKREDFFVEKVPCFNVKQIDNGCLDFHTNDVTRHEKTITTSSVEKRSPPKRLFPRNRQKGIKTKQIRYSQVLLVYWHNRLFGTISAKTLINFYNSSKHSDSN